MTATSSASTEIGSGYLSVVFSDEPAEVLCAFRCRDAIRREHPSVARRLKVQRAGRDDPADRRRSHHVGKAGRVQFVECDKHRRGRVGEQLRHFPGGQHRVDRHHDGTQLPRREEREDVLRDILQVERDPVAAAESIVGQRDSERIRQPIGVAERQYGVEVQQERTVAPRYDGRPEHVQHGHTRCTR